MSTAGRVKRRVAMRRANQLAIGRAGAAGHLTIRCECGGSCGRWISVPSEVYESARSRRWFVTAPGHGAEGDTILFERREYDIVEGGG